MRRHAIIHLLKRTPDEKINAQKFCATETVKCCNSNEKIRDKKSRKSFVYALQCYKGLNQFKMMKRMFNMRYMTPVPPEMIMGLLMFVYLWKGNEKEAFF